MQLCNCATVQLSVRVRTRGRARALAGDGKRDTHQVAVQGLVSDVAQGVHNHGADGDVGHEAAIHGVNVDPVRTGLIHGLHLQWVDRDWHGREQAPTPQC